MLYAIFASLHAIFGGYEPKNCFAGTDVPLLHVYDNDKT